MDWSKSFIYYLRSFWIPDVGYLSLISTSRLLQFTSLEGLSINIPEDWRYLSQTPIKLNLSKSDFEYSLNPRQNAKRIQSLKPPYSTLKELFHLESSHMDGHHFEGCGDEWSGVIEQLCLFRAGLRGVNFSGNAL